MEVCPTLPSKGRDLRLDLFTGIANWVIFFDHIPDNVRKHGFHGLPYDGLIFTGGIGDISGDVQGLIVKGSS
jgi:hypothetical protein